MHGMEFTILSLQGKTLEYATEVAKAAGYRVRIGSVDGCPQILTRDYRRDGLIFNVFNGIVTLVRIG
jgi:hypothetical protein